MATINPAITSNIQAAPTATATSTTGAATSQKTLASNFATFLQLLTTQLKNQNPLDPLDTNQFTQQLVQFAQVEQQLKPNDQLETLVSLQKTAQSTTALGFVGERGWPSTARPQSSRTARRPGPSMCRSRRPPP